MASEETEPKSSEETTADSGAAEHTAPAESATSASTSQGSSPQGSEPAGASSDTGDAMSTPQDGSAAGADGSAAPADAPAPQADVSVGGDGDVTPPEGTAAPDADQPSAEQASAAASESGEGEVKASLLLTRYSPARVETGEMLSVTDVEEVLGLKTIGVIPESGDVLNASNKGEPVILAQDSGAGQAYEDAVARLLGEERPMRFTQLEKKGFFSKLFGG